MDGFSASQRVPPSPSPKTTKIVKARYVSDLVLDSKLDTEISNTYTQHVRYIPGHAASERRVRVVERWIRENPLGRGSYGTVYRERCEEDESKLRAVKEIGKYTMEWEKLDYTRELEAIFKFSHPKYSHCFVCADGWFENDLSVFISMEYLSLGDLGRYLSRPLPECEVQVIFLQIAEGLEYMHDNRFIHRDLKPANIMVVNTGPNWFVKIADFGISKRRWQDSTTTSTLQRGTIAFAAPEQLGFLKASNRGSLTFLSDMWSLGAVAYKLLSKKIPFSDIPDLMNYLSGQLPLPIEILQSKGVSKVAQKLLADLLSPEPHQRPSARLCREHPWISMQIPLTTTEAGTTSTEQFINQDETSKLFEPSAVWSEDIDPEMNITFLNECPSESRLSTPEPLPDVTGYNHSSASLLVKESRQSLANEAATESQSNTPKLLPNVTRRAPSSTSLLVEVEESRHSLIDESASESRPSTPKPLPKVTGRNPSSTSMPVEQVEENPQSLEIPHFSKKFGRWAYYLEELLKHTGGTEGIERKTRLIPLLAERLANVPATVKCSDSYCAWFVHRGPGPKRWLSRAEMFDQQQAPDFPFLVRLLKSYTHTPSPAIQGSSPNESKDLTGHFKLRIRLSGALMLLGKESEAIGILEEVLEWTSLPLIHQAASHQFAAQAYSMQSNWEKAKLHAVQAFQQTSDALGRASDSNKACLRLMVEICNKRMDSGEETQRTGATGSSESPAQQRIRCCHDMMLMLRVRDQMAAADLGVEFLRTNFNLQTPVLPNGGLPCWDCVKQHMLMDGAFLGAFREGATCTKHRAALQTTNGRSSQRLSDYTGLSPVHFLAAATPSTKRWQPRRSCAEEFKWLLATNPEPLTYDNTAIHYNISDATGRAIKMIPVWLAATHGKSEVVALLLSWRQTNLPHRHETNFTYGAMMLCLLPRLGPSSEHQQESIAKALKFVPQRETWKLLAAPGPIDRHWTEFPWCFHSPQLLDVVLENCGEESGNLSIPSMLRGQRHPTNLPLICALLTTFTGGLADTIELLDILILHGADPNMKDPLGRTTLELALRQNRATSLGLGLPEVKLEEARLKVALIRLLLSLDAHPPSGSDFRKEVNLLRVKPYEEPRLEELRQLEKDAGLFREQKDSQWWEESTLKSTLDRLHGDLGFNITEYDAFEVGRSLLDAEIDSVLEVLRNT